MYFYKKLRSFVKIIFFFFFFYIQSKKLQYILLNYTTYKLLYPTTNTIPFGAINYDYLMVTKQETRT